MTPEAYSDIEYYAYVYTNDCQKYGQECVYFQKESSSNGYVSVTYPGVDHVQGRSVVAYMKTVPNNDDVDFVVAFSEHWPGTKHKYKLYTESSNIPAIAVQISKIVNNPKAVITYYDGARFIGYATE